MIFFEDINLKKSIKRYKFNNVSLFEPDVQLENIDSMFVISDINFFNLISDFTDDIQNQGVSNPM